LRASSNLQKKSAVRTQSLPGPTSSFGLALLLAASVVTCAASSTEVPVVNASLGPCTADFTVTDSTGKPIYNAKILVTISYGFMGKRKTDLEIGTNSDGKARFEGLPDRLKKPPMEFKVWTADQEKTVTNDPAVNCHPSFSVAMGKP
jgi:hypothetical protein